MQEPLIRHPEIKKKWKPKPALPTLPVAQKTYLLKEIHYRNDTPIRRNPKVGFRHRSRCQRTEDDAPKHKALTIQTSKSFGFRV